MKAPHTAGSADRKVGEDRAPKRAKRTKEHGPIGFAHVMAHTKAKARPAQAHPAAKGNAQAKLAHGHAVAAHAEAEHAHEEATEAATPAKETQAHDSRASVFGMDIAQLFTGSSAPATAAPTTLTMTAATAQHNAIDGQQQSTMTAQAALHAVAQNAASLTSQDSVRELTIQLEPEHLGPLVVKMRLDGGRLTTEMHVERPEAAAALRSGLAELKTRLQGLGYSTADVTVDQQPEEYFVDPV